MKVLFLLLFTIFFVTTLQNIGEGPLGTFCILIANIIACLDQMKKILLIVLHKAIFIQFAFPSLSETCGKRNERFH